MVTDDNLRDMGRMITPVGHQLKVDSSLNPPRLTDGLYIVDKRQKGRKWVLSIYRNVKTPQNDIEIAIDVFALVWPSKSDYRRALDWLELQRMELEHLPSGIHISKRPDFFRIGLKLEETWSFLRRLQRQLFEIPNNQRWHHPVQPPRFSTAAEQSPQISQVAEAAPTQPSQSEVVNFMMKMAKMACSQSGKESVTTGKNKEWRFDSDEAFRHYVDQLMISGRCALTDIELDLTRADADIAPSLDRIDADGHYEPGNLQVVARFVNRWKSDETDKNFRRLLALVRNQVLNSSVKSSAFSPPRSHP